MAPSLLSQFVPRLVRLASRILQAMHLRRIAARTPQRKPDPAARSHHGERPRSVRTGRSFRALWFVVLLAFAAPAGDVVAQQKESTARAQPARTLLDLSKKETFVLLPPNIPPDQVRVTNVQVRELPTGYTLVPANSSTRLGHPLDIQFDEPENVRIRLAIVKRGKSAALKISPQVVLSDSNTIDLTRDRLTRTTRSFQRHVKNMSKQLAALSRERQSLNIWLLAPGNKPLEAVKATRMRMKLLDQAIRTRQRDIPAIHAHCMTLRQASNFIDKLHQKVEIRYSVEVFPPTRNNK